MFEHYFTHTHAHTRTHTYTHTHTIFHHRSTGFFVFGYALFYYYKRSHMYGTLQTVEFFGYTFLSCYIFFLMLGSVSFFASLTFVRYIYRNLKMD